MKAHPGSDESGLMIKTPDGAVIIVQVEGDEPCEVEVDAPDDCSVKAF
jgi:hypothetical protein